MACASINEFVHKWCREIVFRTRQIQIMEIRVIFREKFRQLAIFNIFLPIYKHVFFNPKQPPRILYLSMILESLKNTLFRGCLGQFENISVELSNETHFLSVSLKMREACASIITCTLSSHGIHNLRPILYKNL